MANEFFKKPQLGNPALTESQKTALPSDDRNAISKAQQASRGIEMLTNLGSGLVNSSTKYYQEHIDAKNKVESSTHTKSFIDYVSNRAMAEDKFDELSTDTLRSKYQQYKEDYIKENGQGEVEPYLRSHLDSMSGSVVGRMIELRDNVGIEKVQNWTSQYGYNQGELYNSNVNTREETIANFKDKVHSMTLARTARVAGELPLTNKQRAAMYEQNYSKSVEYLLKGLVGSSSIKVGELLEDKDFKEALKITDNPEYNKLVDKVKRNGKAIYDAQYSDQKDQLYEMAYGAINNGDEVDPNRAIANAGQFMTEKDKFDFIKKFSEQDAITASTNDYLGNLDSGVNISKGLSPKEAKVVQTSGFMQTLNLDQRTFNIDDISTALNNPLNAGTLKNRLSRGMPYPDSFIREITNPATGLNNLTNVIKSRDVINDLTELSSGTGMPIQSRIGAENVSRILGMARVAENPYIDEKIKQQVVDSISNQDAKFDGNGYFVGFRKTLDEKMNKDFSSQFNQRWQDDTDKWFHNDDYEVQQNILSEKRSYYAMARHSGMDDASAYDYAEKMIEDSNVEVTMPSGDATLIPKWHDNINATSVVEFALNGKTIDANGNSVPRFPSIVSAVKAREKFGGLQRTVTSPIASRISIRRSYNYGKTGKYDMLLDGEIVTDATFSNEEMGSFIDSADLEVRARINKDKSVLTLQESIELGKRRRDASLKRRKNVDEYTKAIDDIFATGSHERGSTLIK